MVLWDFPFKDFFNSPFSVAFDLRRLLRVRKVVGTAEPAPSEVEGPLLRVRRSGGLCRTKKRIAPQEGFSTTPFGQDCI